jgi:hypothetical protein
MRVRQGKSGELIGFTYLVGHVDGAEEHYPWHFEVWFLLFEAWK